MQNEFLSSTLELLKNDFNEMSQKVEITLSHDSCVDLLLIKMPVSLPRALLIEFCDISAVIFLYDCILCKMDLMQARGRCIKD